MWQGKQKDFIDKVTLGLNIKRKVVFTRIDQQETNTTKDTRAWISISGKCKYLESLEVQGQDKMYQN